MTILEGQIFWGDDYDIYNKSNFMKSIMGMFSLMPPLHQYLGRVVLTKTELIILGDTDLTIPLYSIDEVYIGFDEIFPASSVKNLGLFWQPLRVKFRTDETVYMVIDYNGINTNNKIWFDTLQQILR